MKSFKKLFTSALLLACLHTAAYSQGKVAVATTNATAQTDQSTVALIGVVDFTTARHLVKSELPKDTLRCDAEVINDALPEIQSEFTKKGFTNEDANEAASKGWVFVRLASPLPANKCMVRSSYVEFATSFGRLIFRTEPDKADIELNGAPLNKQTYLSKWYPPGSYKVRYTRADRSTVEKVCTVTDGGETDCYAELPPKL